MDTMRNVFWNRIYKLAKEDRNIVILSSDFAAPALDKFKLDLPSQFIPTGISEQNTILVAAGMALNGKKPYCVSIAPFITMRCFEQIRLYLGGMNLPVRIVGVGAGISYEDSGPTHHAVEDIALMRILPHMQIFQPCDNYATEKMAEMTVKINNPVYVRLDRAPMPDLYVHNEDISSGITVIRPVSDINILATGNMVHEALKAADLLNEQGINVGVADISVFPVNSKLFSKLFATSKFLVTMEEHSLNGGLGSNILELVSDLNLAAKVKRIGFDFSDGYTYEYGGRSVVHKLYGMDADTVKNVVIMQHNLLGLH